MNRSLFVLAFTATLFFCNCQSAQALQSEWSASLWAPGSRIPVCWISPGFDPEKATIVQAIRSQWERFGNISFDWVGDCPTSGSSKLIRAQVVLGTDQGGGAAFSTGPAALRSPTEGASGTFNIPQSGSLSRIQNLVVHEFGHVLGFGHEHDRVDNPLPNCGQRGTITGTFFTSFDISSIMNTGCNQNGNNSGELSDGDKSGVVKAYGAAVGGMLLSDTNSGLAINAFGGARHLTPLKLASNCSKNNPDCTWTYRDGMLVTQTHHSQLTLTEVLRIEVL